MTHIYSSLILPAECLAGVWVWLGVVEPVVDGLPDVVDVVLDHAVVAERSCNDDSADKEKEVAIFHHFGD